MIVYLCVESGLCEINQMTTFRIVVYLKFAIPIEFIFAIHSQCSESRDLFLLVLGFNPFF
jgi:hypothetical protein